MDLIDNGSYFIQNVKLYVAFGFNHKPIKFHTSYKFTTIWVHMARPKEQMTKFLILFVDIFYIILMSCL